MGNNQKHVYLFHFHSKTGTCSSEKHTTRPTWWAEWTSNLLLRDNGTGTTGYGYILCMVFNSFWSFFLLNHWPIVYIVLRCCFGRYIFFCFWFVFALITFSHVRVSFHYSTIMRTSASTSTYSYVHTTHVTRLLYPLPVDSIGHKTGTRRHQVENTRLPPQNSSGALAPWSYPEPAWAIQTEPGHVEVYN